MAHVGVTRHKSQACMHAICNQCRLYELNIGSLFHKQIVYGPSFYARRSQNELGAVVFDRNSCADNEECVVYTSGPVQPGVLQVAIDLPAIASV